MSEVKVGGKVNVSTNYKFYTLNATNYGTWKWQFTNVMRALKYIPKLLNKDHDNPEMDAEALALLGSTIDEKNARTIQNYTTFREAYEAIIKMHENKTTDEKQSLFERLNSYRVKDVSSVNEGISEIMEIVAQLKSMNEAISETNIIGVMSASLPSEFDLFKMAWKGTPEDRRNVEEFMARVFAEASDLKKKQTEETQTALLTRHKNQRNNDRRNNNRSKNDTVCRYCREPGHWIQDCKKLKQPYDPDYKKSNSKRNDHDNNENQGDRNVSFMVHTSSQRDYDLTTWVIDSGCTSHMSPYKQLFSEMKVSNEEVGLANSDTKLKAEGIGSIKTKQGTLRSVHYVPGLSQNLFSVSTAVMNGLKYVGTGHEMIFYKDQMELFRAKLDNKLFIVVFEPCDPTLIAMVATRSIWHSRFSHVASKTIDHMKRNGIVEDLDIVETVPEKCIHCAMSKCTCKPHPQKTTPKSETPGEVLHVDTSGLITPKSLGGAQYIVLCKDEYSALRQVAFVAKKSDIADHVKQFITLAELETGNRCLKLVSDNGSEFVNSKLSAFLREKGIVHDTSAPYVPQQNGYIERDFRTVTEAVRSILAESKLDRKMWAEATNCAIYVLNRVTKHDKTPYERWFNKKPSVANLHMFGEEAIIKIKQHTKKFEDRGRRAIFLGYTNVSNTFRFLCDGKVTTTCDCEFTNRIAKQIEDPQNQTNNPKQAPEERFAISVCRYEPAIIQSTRLEGKTTGQSSDIETSADSYADANLSESPVIEHPEEQLAENDQELDEKFEAEERMYRSLLNQAMEDDEMDNSERSSGTSTVIIQEIDQSQPVYGLSGGPQSSTPIVRRPEIKYDSLGRPIPPRDASGRFLPKANRGNRAGLATLNDLEELPKTYKQATERQDWNRWKAAIEDEMASLIKNKVFIEVPASKATSEPIDSRWVLTLKRNADGSVSKYKARVVARGYNQRYGIDYTETYCPVVHLVTLRMILAYAEQRSLIIKQFDVKTAFLYGELEETIFMIPPDGYKHGDKIWLLKRSLYGLKQASRMWNITFDRFLKDQNLNVSTSDSCIYYQVSPIIVVVIYVDDGIICAERRQDAERIMRSLEHRFEIRELDLTQYRGLQIERDAEGIVIHQSTYVQKILKEFAMHQSAAERNPIASASNTSTIDSGLFADRELYLKAVGCLIYLAESSRPDIMHAVNRVSRKVAAPTNDDWKKVKRIFRYLRGQPRFGIRYTKSNHSLIAFCDSDFAGDSETKRSTTGYIIMLGNGAIHWKSQRQKHVSLSSTEAEYISMCSTAKEVVWLRKIGIELGMIESEPVQLLCDNKSAICIARSERATVRTRHLGAQEAYVKELIEDGTLSIRYVRANDQLADFLTKPISTNKFVEVRDQIMIDLEL